MKRIGRLIREHEADAERECRLSKPVVEAMTSAGLYRMCKPRAFGGLEIDALSALRVYEEVARFDTSAAWKLLIGTYGYSFAVWLPDEGGREVLSNSDAILAGALREGPEAMTSKSGTCSFRRRAPV